MRTTLAELLAALADGTRLRVLHLLGSGPLCVGDLVALLQLPQPSVSRHLAVLRNRGLVRVRTADRWRIYSLTPADDDLSRAVHGLLHAAASGDAGLQRDLERRAELALTGGCCPALAAGAHGAASGSAVEAVRGRARESAS